MGVARQHARRGEGSASAGEIAPPCRERPGDVGARSIRFAMTNASDALLRRGATVESTAHMKRRRLNAETSALSSANHSPFPRLVANRRCQGPDAAPGLSPTPAQTERVRRPSRTSHKYRLILSTTSGTFTPIR
jgi:hypothetical protein